MKSVFGLFLIIFEFVKSKSKVKLSSRRSFFFSGKNKSNLIRIKCTINNNLSFCAKLTETIDIDKGIGRMCHRLYVKEFIKTKIKTETQIEMRQHSATHKNKTIFLVFFFLLLVVAKKNIARSPLVIILLWQNHINYGRKKKERHDDSHSVFGRWAIRQDASKRKYFRFEMTYVIVISYRKGH